MNGPSEITTQATREKSEGGLGVLRALALLALMVGGGGSVGFMLRACQRNPSRLLLVLLAIWVLSPFLALAWANVVSKRWKVVTRTAHYCMTLVLALGSLAVYGDIVKVKPHGSPNAFLFVAVPPVLWLIMAIVFAIAALLSRRRSHFRTEHEGQ
jgi:hypothetical protein